MALCFSSKSEEGGGVRTEMYEEAFKNEEMFSGEGEYEWPGGSSVSRFFFPGVVCGIRWLGWLEGLSWKKLLRRLFLSWT